MPQFLLPIPLGIGHSSRLDKVHETTFQCRSRTKGGEMIALLSVCFHQEATRVLKKVPFNTNEKVGRKNTRQNLL
jgi:hypothetical protein